MKGKSIADLSNRLEFVTSMTKKFAASVVFFTLLLSKEWEYIENKRGRLYNENIREDIKW